jgi:hypothetical protein
MIPLEIRISEKDDEAIFHQEEIVYDCFFNKNIMQTAN